MKLELQFCRLLIGMELINLNTTEWWVLRERIKNVDIKTHGHYMRDDTYVLTISDNTGQKFELEMFVSDLDTILEPTLVRKL